MKKTLLFLSFIATIALFSSCQQDKSTYVLISTTKGDMKIELYDSTPKHKENFIKLAKEGFYDDLLFHRVIKGFMVQGGDPKSKGAPAGQSLGSGGPGYQIDAEIGAPHFRGTLAAARTGGPGNPLKKSSGSQFYIIDGKPVNDQTLDGLEKQKGIKYNAAQRAKYKELGGAPFLDADYTVFGEVVEGFDVISKIADVETKSDRPLEDIKMTVKVLN